MSYQGYLMYGDRGPIIGKWPVEKVESFDIIHAGESIVIDNGTIRRPVYPEVGTKLPADSIIIGHRIDVPPWWWWLHFGERLLATYPAERCCWDGAFEGPQCGDCPR